MGDGRAIDAGAFSSENFACYNYLAINAGEDAPSLVKVDGSGIRHGSLPSQAELLPDRFHLALDGSVEPYAAWGPKGGLLEFREMEVFFELDLAEGTLKRGPYSPDVWSERAYREAVERGLEMEEAMWELNTAKGDAHLSHFFNDECEMAEGAPPWDWERNEPKVVGELADHLCGMFGTRRLW